MIKNVLLNLAIGVHNDATIGYAVSLARGFEAHLAAVAFAYEPVPTAMLADDIPPEWLEEMRREADAAAKAAVVAFDEAAWRGGISAEAQRLSSTFDGTADRFGRMARRFDLAVIRQAEPDKSSSPTSLIIEAALFESGRPVLVVPYIQKTDMKLDRVMVCWDGSRSAARAVGDAMPFLERAGAVEVVVVTEHGKEDEIPGAQVATHLARHGTTVEVKQIVAPGGNVAETLLSHAADSTADFLVLGAYGHSRLREFILGGVTRSMLESMTVPVLMSH
jgi:nucleotide-binding universal stress UspA family protein